MSRKNPIISLCQLLVSAARLRPVFATGRTKSESVRVLWISPELSNCLGGQFDTATGGRSKAPRLPRRTIWRSKECDRTLRGLARCPNGKSCREVNANPREEATGRFLGL